MSNNIIWDVFYVPHTYISKLGESNVSAEYLSLNKHRYTPQNWHLQIFLYCFLSIHIRRIQIQRDTKYSKLCSVCAAARDRGFLTCHTLEYWFQSIRLWDTQNSLYTLFPKVPLTVVTRYSKTYFLDTSFVTLWK